MSAMYEIGTIVLYERRGIYKVADIGVPPLREDDTQLYYKLFPVFSDHNEIIYIPVDTTAFMRLPISECEAVDYLELYQQLNPQIFPSRKTTDLIAHYRDLLSSCKLEDCLLLVKELYIKQKDLASRNKKLGQIDMQYLKIAERLVCEEFSVVLHSTPEEIRKRLYAGARSKATV